MRYEVCNEERNTNLLGVAEAVYELAKRINTLYERNAVPTEEAESAEIERFFKSRLFSKHIASRGKCDDLRKELYEDAVEKKWSPFFIVDDDDVLCCKEWLRRNAERFRMPYTKEEVLFLKYIAEDGGMRYFFTEEQCKAITEEMNRYLEECGIDASETQRIREFVEIKGRSNMRETADGSLANKFMKILQCATKAIKLRCVLEVFPKTGKTFICYPLALTFSQLEERMRIFCYLPAKEKYERLYLSDISDVVIKENFDAEALPEIKEKTLLIAVRAKENTEERLCSRLMEYELIHLRGGKEDIRYVLVTYPEIDRQRVENRLLSVAHNARVIDEKKIIDRIKKRNNSWPDSVTAEETAASGTEMKKAILDAVEKMRKHYENV